MSPNTLANGQRRLLSLLDQDVPIEIRRTMLAELVMSNEAGHHELIANLFDSARAGQIDALAEEKLKEAQALIDQLKSGPLRPANFVAWADTNGSQPVCAQVGLGNGDATFPIVVDERLLTSLKCNDPVLVDAQARCILFRDSTQQQTGEIARFDRRLEGNLVRVTLREHEPQVVLASDELLRQLEENGAPGGRQVLVCTRRQMALAALPAEDGLSHYRFLSREPVPDVLIDRDLGDPPQFIFDVLEHFDREMTDPALGRKYGIRRAMTKMLAGVSGSGKTMSIEATIRATYELMSRHTGVPVEELPHRVMRLRSSTLLSKWLGDSDKNADRFFDEVLQLADEKLIALTGAEFELLVIVVIEECDAIGRERGGAGEQVYDRIQTTVLERLDANSRRFGSRLVLVLCTTNVPSLIDPAFLRRLGGTIEHFGRLSRKGLAAVLEKHLAGLPIAAEFGDDQRQRERQLKRTVLDWFYSAGNHDPGQVELTFVGSAQPFIAFRREFLTAGLVDRALQQAAAAACRREAPSRGDSGIGRELLLAAFSHQIRAIANQLSPHNVQNYMTLPEGVRVAQVRRIEQPRLSLHELERPTARERRSAEDSECQPAY